MEEHAIAGKLVLGLIDRPAPPLELGAIPPVVVAEELLKVVVVVEEGLAVGTALKTVWTYPE